MIIIGIGMGGLKSIEGYEVREFVDRDGSNPYRQWLDDLDLSIKARVQARILRFELGNLGDYKSVGNGVYEARFTFGSGYRVYFGIEGRRLILLLLGGDKSTQSQDIRKAEGYWQKYQEVTSHVTKK